MEANREGFIDLSFLNDEENVPRGTIQESPKEEAGQAQSTQQAEAQGQAQNPNTPISEGLDSTIIITFADMIISRVLSIGMNFATGTKIPFSELQMNATEVNKIKPLASRLIEKYAVKFKDEYALLVMLFIIYGSKLAIAEMNSNKPKKEAKKESEIPENEKWPNYKTHLKNGKPRKTPLA